MTLCLHTLSDISAKCLSWLNEDYYIFLTLNSNKNKLNIIKDKAYIVMKKVPYDVIQKMEKVTKKDSEYFKLNCALKKEKYLNNFIKLFLATFSIFE